MVRKLELTATLSVDVPLYLLDEPTAELDLTSVDQFHAILDERVNQRATVVMTSPTPRDAYAADRVVFVADGQIVAEGDPDAVLESVPPVVMVTARVDAEDVRECVRTGQLFESDTARRGFLASKTDPTVIEGLNDACIDEPKWVDFSNYYVHISPQKTNDGS